jgi:hypothetical protein
MFALSINLQVLLCWKIIIKLLGYPELFLAKGISSASAFKDCRTPLILGEEH